MAVTLHAGDCHVSISVLALGLEGLDSGRPEIALEFLTIDPLPQQISRTAISYHLSLPNC